MLESLVYLELLWYHASIDAMPSKKVSSADNQQERLRAGYWIAGFTIVRRILRDYTPSPDVASEKI